MTDLMLMTFSKKEISRAINASHSRQFAHFRLVKISIRNSKQLSSRNLVRKDLNRPGSTGQWSEHDNRPLILHFFFRAYGTMKAYQAISPPMANGGRNSALQQPLLIAPAVEDQYLTPSWSPDIRNSARHPHGSSCCCSFRKWHERCPRTRTTKGSGSRCRPCLQCCGTRRS